MNPIKKYESNAIHINPESNVEKDFKFANEIEMMKDAMFFENLGYTVNRYIDYSDIIRPFRFKITGYANRLE